MFLIRILSRFLTILNNYHCRSIHFVLRLFHISCHFPTTFSGAANYTITSRDSALGSDILKKAIKLGVLCFCLAVVTALFMGLKARATEYKFNMSYIFFSNTSDYTSMVDSTQNSLNEVSPNYFELTHDGSLTLTSSVSETFISDMHARGITVVPFLTNDWSRAVGTAALARRGELAATLSDAVATYGLDGVNIDIENVTAAERNAYVDFVKTLRELLGPGKTIAVSVAPNPWGIDTGWQGSYNYAGLAAYCDYLMIMGYDEHYFGGPPGPVSSYDFLDKSLKYAVSVVPPEKVVLGLPFYGRIWAGDGCFPNGYGLTNSKIAQLVSHYGGSVKLDSFSRSTSAVITVSQGDARLFVGGQALDAGTYTIWYENEQSIKAKLELVGKYGIKGTGSWALGQESDNTWDYYKLWLNNCTFADIEQNRSKEFILNAYLKHWVTGYSADNFSPEEPLTRAQAAVILVRRLGLTPESDPAYRFTDCVGSWAEAYLETARKHHIISGTGDNIFDPDRPITRQELAVMINNIVMYQNNAGSNVFTDVTPVSNPWSYASIQALGAGGIISGNSDGSFTPCGQVSRAEMTVFISSPILTLPPDVSTAAAPDTPLQAEAEGLPSP
jgi:spore germination protein YaaH